MELKDALTIHKGFLKNYPANSIVLNLKNLPDIEYCCIHEDGKGWGKIVKNGIEYNIGRNNHKTKYLLYNNLNYDSSNKQVFVLHENQEVVRTYTSFIKENISKVWYDCLSVEDLRKINPILFANFYDYWNTVNVKDRYSFNFRQILIRLDQSTQSLSKSSGLPIKYFRILVENGWQYKDTIKEMIELKFSPEECSKYLSIAYYLPSCYKYNKSVLTKYLNISYSEQDYYRDYLRMLREMPIEIQRGFPICPNNIDKSHNRLLNLYNRQLIIRKQKRNENLNIKYVENILPLIKEFEYTNNEYIISAPLLVTDLIEEGTVLNHCVGSYMESVSNGNEYILFLRKKSDPDIPYFTINITPRRTIRQIHGKNNCNVPPELVSFIEKWKIKFKLSGNYNKCLAHL